MPRYSPLEIPRWIVCARVPDKALQGVCCWHPRWPDILGRKAESLASDIAVVGIASRAENDGSATQTLTSADANQQIDDLFQAWRERTNAKYQALRHQAVCEALTFKTDCLWVQQDALFHAYVNGHVPPGAFRPEQP